MSNILRAAVFAGTAHGTQMRKGVRPEPYINHPLRVSYTIARLFPQHETAVIAALLHDVLEDTKRTELQIEQEFGGEVLRLVKELTDAKGAPPEIRKKLQAAKMPSLLFPAKVIKVADQLDNVKDVAYNPPVGWSFDKRRDYINAAGEVVSMASIGGTEAADMLLAEFEHAFASGMQAINAQEALGNPAD